MPFGRLKRAARSAKDRLSGGDGGPTISEVGDQYLVIDGEESHGPYQKRMHAAAKVRELKRERTQAQQSIGETVSAGADKLAQYGESLGDGAGGNGGPQLPGETDGRETGDARGGGPVLPGMEGGAEPAIPLLDDDADGAEPARGESRLPFMDEPADGDEDGNRDDPPWML